MAAQLASAGGALCLYKVAAHRGIIDNELADSIARRVARGNLQDNTAGLTVQGVIPGASAGAPPSNDRASIPWSWVVDPRARVLRIPPSCGCHCPTMRRRCGGMPSASSSATPMSRRFTLPPGLRLRPRCLTLPPITSCPAPRLLIRRRAGSCCGSALGTLPSGALAFKYGLRPDDSCALCGQPDGRMLAISGCRACAAPSSSGITRSGASWSLPSRLARLGEAWSWRTWAAAPAVMLTLVFACCLACRGTPLEPLWLPPLRGR